MVRKTRDAFSRLAVERKLGKKKKRKKTSQKNNIQECCFSSLEGTPVFQRVNKPHSPPSAFRQVFSVSSFFSSAIFVSVALLTVRINYRSYSVIRRTVFFQEIPNFY